MIRRYWCRHGNYDDRAPPENCSVVGKALSHGADPACIRRAGHVDTTLECRNPALVGIEPVDGEVTMEGRHQRGADVTKAHNRNVCFTTR